MDDAFASVQQSLAPRRCEPVFKESLTTMQVRAKEFVVQPQAS